MEGDDSYPRHLVSMYSKPSRKCRRVGLTFVRDYVLKQQHDDVREGLILVDRRGALPYVTRDERHWIIGVYRGGHARKLIREGRCGEVHVCELKVWLKMRR